MDKQATRIRGKARLWRILRNPIQVPWWVIGLIVASMVGWAIIQNVEHRREMEKKWNATDRPKIENLSYALKKWSVLDMDVQETLIGGWEMLHELGPGCDPRDVAMLNQLANAYVTQGKYDLAITPCTRNVWRSSRGIWNRHTRMWL